MKATLYYEVFCPGCEQFILEELVPFRQTEDLMAITDLEIVPYGNAHVLTRDPPTFQCQHGDKECYGNWVELCAQKHFPEALWWKFIVCEEASPDFSEEGIRKCAQEATIDAGVILECANGKEGPLLHLEAADKTPADHKWVPWIVVDGKALGEEDEFIDSICKAYTGEKPASCKKAVSKVDAAPKVKATLYYEVFCPGCEQFILEELVPFRQTEDLMAITDLEIVPYGNAHVLTRDPPTFQCQHGDKECYGNWVELCAQKHFPEALWWKFIVCEEASPDFSEEGIRKCAQEATIDAGVILECANGKEGPLLHLEAADKTPAEHRWVPYTVIDGKVMPEEFDFKKAICDAYTGEKPAACKN